MFVQKTESGDKSCIPAFGTSRANCSPDISDRSRWVHHKSRHLSRWLAYGPARTFRAEDDTMALTDAEPQVHLSLMNGCDLSGANPIASAVDHSMRDAAREDRSAEIKSTPQKRWRGGIGILDLEQQLRGPPAKAEETQSLCNEASSRPATG